MSVKSGGYNFRVPKAASSAKELLHVEIHKAENGGHIVKHIFASRGEFHEPEMHAFGKGEGKDLLAHVSKTMDVPAHKEGAQPRNANDDAVDPEPDGKVEATV